MEDWAEVHRLFHREGLRQGGDRPPARDEPQHGRAAARPVRAAALCPPTDRLPARPVHRAHRGDARRRPDGPRDGHPRAPPARRDTGRDHDPQGPSRAGPPDVPRRPGVPAHDVPPGRDRPGRLVAHRRPGPGRAGRDAGRPSVWSTTLPFSAAHAIDLQPVADRRRPAPGSASAASARLGGVPEKLVFDNDASVVAAGSGSRARLHDEVTGLLGALRTRPVVLRPASPDVQGRRRAHDRLCSRRASCRSATSARSRTSRTSTTPGPPTSPIRRHIRRLGGTVAERLRRRARVPRATARSAARHRPPPRGPGRQGRLRPGARRRLLGPARLRRPTGRRSGSARPRSASRARAREIAVHAPELRAGRRRPRPGPRPGDPPRPGGPRPAGRRRRRAARGRPRPV